MPESNGILAEGARRVWGYQRVLWWLFLVNYVLAAFGTASFSLPAGRLADHSVYAQGMAQGFDVGVFFDLASNPDVGFASRMPAALLFTFIFFVFSLFLTGGILEAYRCGRKLPAGEFF